MLSVFLLFFFYASNLGTIVLFYLSLRFSSIVINGVLTIRSFAIIGKVWTYPKLDSNNSKVILNKYDSLIINNSFDTYFICNNCNYHTKITSGTKIFETSFKENKITDDSLLNLRIMDNTLPRTKDFICPNENCNSHKKENEKTREAVFYRPYNNRYDVKYICSECVTLWNP